MIVIAFALLVPSEAHAVVPSRVRAARAALDSSRTEEAASLVAALEADAPDDADVLAVGAELRFQKAEYADALDRIRRALALRRADESLKSLRDRIEAAERVTRGWATVRVRGVVVRHPPGRDSVLAPYAAEALERAAEAIQEDLGDRPPGPIVVEVFPDGESLSSVSGLPLADISRTGTIAISKWGRLLVTSPRALVRGYPWLDTLAHEYVHLVVTRVTDDRAPIWLQEGLAKFEERRWRDPPGGRLEPGLAYLLDRAAQTDRFIPFARMHPSIARLGSQEEAALAFAEVFTFVRFVHARAGYEGIRDVLARVRGGADAMDAVSDAIHAPWANLYRWWRGEIRSRRNAPPRAARVLEMRFREGTRAPDETREIASETARRHARVGDLLWDRDRKRAAAAEYQHASSASPDDPVVANRLARALLETGQAERVPDALGETLGLYPDFPATQVHLGQAHMAVHHARQAIAAFEEAIRLNPFDPEPHCALATLYGPDDRRSGREEDACGLLR
jgi:Flp pilus assembly protein TadD